MIGDSEEMSGARKAERAPPAWLGVTLPVWVKVLARYRFPVSARQFWRFLLPTLASPWNSLFATMETLRYGRGIGAVRIEPPPVFIVGFLRTGSTLLHELLAADARHTAPTMYQCTAPKHFLTTRSIAGPLLESRVPRRRPMDNMVQGLYRPFEDEFALCFNGHDSIYMFFFFPKSAGRAAAALDVRENPRWRSDFERFLKAVLLNRRGQRLILKSPPHTSRVRMLSEMFPGARFIHLVRDPLGVVPSALHTVRALVETYGLQTASAADIEDWVFRNFDAMHRSIEESRPLLAPGRFHEVRYEALALNPIAELEQIYARLDLGDFAPARPAVEDYLAAIKGYRKNRFDIDLDLRRKILDRCGWVMERYGYGRA